MQKPVNIKKDCKGENTNKEKTMEKERELRKCTKSGKA